MRFIDREEVSRRLTYEMCIPIVRSAMTKFSRGETKQLLRSIIPLSEGRFFGVMPGAMGAFETFERSCSVFSMGMPIVEFSRIKDWSFYSILQPERPSALSMRAR